MGQLRFEIRAWPRPVEAVTDDALGEGLVERLRAAIAAGSRGSASVVVRAGQLELVRWRPDDVPFPIRMATLAMTDLPDGGPAEAVGVFGVFEGAPAPRAAVFLEWPDCRWWLWEGQLSGSGSALVDDSVRVRRATDGAALPDGLGRWWSLGRRMGIRGRLTRSGPPAETVH